MTRRRCAIALAVLWSAALPAAAGGGVVRGPAFEVCMLENNAPYAERASSSGFDIAVGSAIASATGRELKPHWIANDTRITEIDETDLPVTRLVRGQCDAILSVPGPVEHAFGGREDVVLSEPYYGAGFELVTCGGDVPLDIRALGGRTVAIRSQTVAHFALSAVGAEPRTYFSLGEAFAAVPAGDAEAALLWGPGIGFLLRRARISGEVKRRPELAPCGIAAGYVPPRALRWNLHVALRARDRRLRADVDKALVTLRDTGELAKMMSGFGIPQHAPFDTVYGPGALDALREKAP